MRVLDLLHVLDGFQVAGLREVCKDAGLESTGIRTQLVSKLVDHYLPIPPLPAAPKSTPAEKALACLNKFIIPESFEDVTLAFEDEPVIPLNRSAGLTGCSFR